MSVVLCCEVVSDRLLVTCLLRQAACLLHSSPEEVLSSTLFFTRRCWYIAPGARTSILDSISTNQAFSLWYVYSYTSNTNGVLFVFVFVFSAIQCVGSVPSSGLSPQYSYLITLFVFVFVFVFSPNPMLVVCRGQWPLPAAAPAPPSGNAAAAPSEKFADHREQIFRPQRTNISTTEQIFSNIMHPNS